MTAYAAASGSGTQSDPWTASSSLSAGDTAPSGAYFRSLTAVHNKTLSFAAQFSPKEYTLLYHASGGSIPGAGETKSVTVKYNDGSGATSDTLSLPTAPQRSGYTFMGWYLKGNQADTILKDGTRYMLAADDSSDTKEAELSGSAAVARALWRSAADAQPDDENGADFLPETADPDDPWDSAHSHNHVIAKEDGVFDRAAYRRAHGKTAYQYARVLFDAETSSASGYTWYVNGTRQSTAASSFLLSDIGGDLDGAAVSCTVLLNDGKTTLDYAAKLTVYSLPKITATEFSFRSS